MSSSTKSRQRGQPKSNMDVSNIPPPPMFKPPPLPSDDDDVFVRTISRTRSPTPKLSLPGKTIESLTDKKENNSDKSQKPVNSSIMLAGVKSCKEDIDLSRIQPPQEVKIIIDTFEESNKKEENKANSTIHILGGCTSPGSVQKCIPNKTPVPTAQLVTKEKQQDIEPTTLPAESEIGISNLTSSEGQLNRQKSGSTDKFEIDKEDGENNQKHSFYEAFPPQKEIPLKTKFKRRNSKKKPIKCPEKFVIQQEKCDSDSVQISGKTNEEVAVISVEEDIVLKEDNMTPKEKIITSEVLNSRRSMSRSSSRIGYSPIPHAESEVLPCNKNVKPSVETKDGEKSDEKYCLSSKGTKEKESQRLESESLFPKAKVQFEENNSQNRPGDNSETSQQYIQSEENDGNITTIISNQGSISEITGRDHDCGTGEKDLADEIITSCNDVNDILARIMNSTSHEDEDISYSPDNFKLNEIDPQNENTSDEKCTSDYFEMVENIADLTVDNIKEHLLKEEKDSNKVKTFKADGSENKIDDMEVLSNKHTDFSLLTQHGKEVNLKENSTLELSSMNLDIVKASTKKNGNDSIHNDDYHTEKVASSNTFSNEATAASKNNKKPLYLSKKEQQLAKIQDFLKDPATEGRENINIPVRLKKSDVEKEEASMEINKLVDGLHISSFAALNQSNLMEHSVTSVVHISTKYCAVAKVENHHIKLATEDINSLEKEFDTVADVVFRVREKDGETLIACEESVGVAAVMCVAFLVKHEGMNLLAAMQLVHEKRPNVKMHQGLLVRLKEWEKLRHHGSPFDRISELLISWLPLMFAILISYLAIKTFLDNVDKQHSEDKIGDVKTLYDYFHVLKWP